MAKPEYAPKLDTVRDIRKAIEDLWADLMQARHSLYFEVIFAEREWSNAVTPDFGPKAEPHIANALSSRLWLVHTAAKSVEAATDQLTYLINEIPEEVQTDA